jgi:hypothetical protein
MQILSKIHRNLNYVIIGFLGLILLWVVVVTMLARAQTDAARTLQQPALRPTEGN